MRQAVKETGGSDAERDLDTMLWLANMWTTTNVRSCSMSALFHVVCPDCDAVNRIPRTRPAQDAKCGGCGVKLFTGKPVELGGERFRRHVSRSDIPVVADF